MLSRFPLNFSGCRQTISAFAVLAILILLFNLPAPAAAAGDLDASFGQDGITLPVGGNFASAFSLAVQADGKILAGGYAGNSFALARFFPNGSLDTSFGSGGRVTDGVWYAQRSRDGFFGAQFGTGSDKPVAADYDGDGKTDLAVFRPSDGTWYLQRSHLGFTAIQFGISTDKAVPADYDNDGRTDIAVYRGGTWYLQQSTAGFRAAQFGASTDVPVPSAFVP